MILLIGMVLLLVAAPSLICQSPLARTIAQRRIVEYGLEGSFESVRIGWVTPLRVKNLKLLGTAGETRLSVEQIDGGVNLLQVIFGLRDPIHLSARGVVVDGKVGPGWSGPEIDADAVMAAMESGSTSGDSDGSSSGRALPEITVDIQNMTVKMTDTVTGEVSGLDQARLEAKWGGGEVVAGFSAVLSDAVAGSGAIDAAIRYDLVTAGGGSVELKMQGLPLRIATLVRRRFPDSASSIPEQLSGDATGTLRLAGGGEAAWAIDAEGLEVRNLVASDPAIGPQVWRNGLLVLNGKAVVDDRGVTGNGLRLASDFAELSLDGSLLTPQDSVQAVNPIAWLKALDGTATASINLVTLADRLPGVLPLRDQTELVAGSISAEIASHPDAMGARLVNASIRSEPIRARAGGRNVVFDPAVVEGKIRIDAADDWQADACRLTSAFGSATLDGDLSNGRAQANFDLGRLAAMLEPLVQMPQLQLAGIAEGKLQWSARPNDLWELKGDGNATNLHVELPGGIRLHRPTIDVIVDATGRWAGGALAELTAAEVTLKSNSLEADMILVQSVTSPAVDTVWPLRLTSRGRLEVLAEFLGPWMPESLTQLHGGYSGRAEGRFGLAEGELTQAVVTLEEPRGAWDGAMFAQSRLAGEFDGSYVWPSGNLVAKSFKLTGEAISGAAKGTMADDTIDLELAWRADLQRLQASVQPVIAAIAPPTTPATQSARLASLPAAGVTSVADQWLWRGDCEGDVRVVKRAGDTKISVETHAKGANLALIQPVAVSVGGGRSGVTPNASSGSRAGETVWAEPTLAIDGVMIYDTTDGHLETEKLQVVTVWVATSLSGQVAWNDQRGAIRLSGPSRVRMEEVAKQLTTLAGTEIRLQGIHETPLEIAVDRREDGSAAVDIKANLGWESGEIAGVVFGPSVIPVVMNETTVAIRQANIPVGEGRITASADVHYSPGPLWMDVKPGVIAQNLRLTPELSDRWLQYLAPMVAQATRIDGTFGVELAQAAVNLEEPLKSRVRGQLQINKVDFDAGPMANQLLSSVQQVQMIVKGLPAADGQAAAPSRKLATLPTQSVDFDFTDGFITHQRMFMDVDRARLITSGQVNVDGRINLVTQLPLDANWLGSDLKSLAGVTVNMPITGTLSSPRLDPAGIRNLVTQVGGQALQQTAENYLEKQLNRGLERLLGK